MAKISQMPSLDGLRLSQRLVADHGDAMRFSLSKKGRIWLTFTHWDNEKYNTSVELDSFDDVTAVLGALAVLAVAHYAKCFRGIAHTDTWTGIDETKQLVGAALAQCAEYLGTLDSNVEKSPPSEADTAS